MGYYDNRGNRGPYRGGYDNYGRNNNYGGGRYDQRPQYSDPGYDRSRGYDDQPARKYNVGDVLRIVDTDVIVRVIHLGREQYECRLPDLRTQYFYEHELEPAPDKNN